MPNSTSPNSRLRDRVRDRRFRNEVGISTDRAMDIIESRSAPEDVQRAMRVNQAKRTGAFGAIRDKFNREGEPYGLTMGEDSKIRRVESKSAAGSETGPSKKEQRQIAQQKAQAELAKRQAAEAKARNEALTQAAEAKAIEEAAIVAAKKARFKSQDDALASEYTSKSSYAATLKTQANAAQRKLEDLQKAQENAAKDSLPPPEGMEEAATAYEALRIAAAKAEDEALKASKNIESWKESSRPERLAAEEFEIGIPVRKVKRSSGIEVSDAITLPKVEMTKSGGGQSVDFDGGKSQPVNPVSSKGLLAIGAMKDFLAVVPDSRLHADMQDSIKAREESPDEWENAQVDALQAATPDVIAGQIETWNQVAQQHVLKVQEVQQTFNQAQQMSMQKIEALSSDNAKAMRDGQFTMSERVIDEQGNPWSKVLWTERQRLQQQMAQERAEMEEALAKEQNELERTNRIQVARQARLQELQAEAKMKQAKAIDEKAADMRASGLTAEADQFRRLSAEYEAREKMVAEKFPQDGPARQAALKALADEKQAAAKLLDDNIQVKPAKAADLRDSWAKDLSYDWSKVKQGDDIYLRMKQEAEKRGMSVEDAKYWLTTLDQMDWSKASNIEANAKGLDSKAQPGSTRMLPNGGVLVNPSLLLDAQAFEEALKASNATQEAQDRARKARQEEAPAMAAEMLKTLRKNSDFAAWLEKNTKGSDLERMEQFVAQMREGGAWNMAKMKVGEGLAGLGKSWTGTMAAITGADMFTQGKVPSMLSAKTWEDRAAAYGYASAQSEKETNILTSYMAKAAGIMPSVMASLSAGAAAGGLVKGAAALRGASAMAQTGFQLKKGADYATAAAKAAGWSDKVATTAGVAGSSIDAGLQSLGGTYVDAYTEALKNEFGSMAFAADGAKPTEEQIIAAKDKARATALLPAIASGLATAAITALGGASGVEAVFKGKGSQSLADAIKAPLLRKMAGMGIEGGSEFIEEFSDQLAQGAIAKFTYNPEMTASDVLEQAIEAGVLGFLAGAGIKGVQELKGWERTPEGKAAASATLADEMGRISDPTVKAQAEAVQAVLEGRSFGQLTESQLAALNLKRQGDKFVQADKAVPVGAYEQDGQIVLTDDSLDSALTNVPGLNIYAPASERARLDQIAEGATNESPKATPPTSDSGRERVADHSAVGGGAVEGAKSGSGVVGSTTDSSESSGAGSSPTSRSSVDQAAQAAATSKANDLPQPTEAQKKAGNYPMGHVKLSGLDITIENPDGSERGWTNEDTGEKGVSKINGHYGYIKNTVGADGDHVDVLVKAGTPEDWNGTVYVIKQLKSDGKTFDEHKIYIGFESEAEAKKAYKSNYQKGWRGYGGFIPMSISQLAADVKAGKLKNSTPQNTNETTSARPEARPSLSPSPEDQTAPVEDETEKEAGAIPTGPDGDTSPAEGQDGDRASNAGGEWSIRTQSGKRLSIPADQAANSKQAIEIFAGMAKRGDLLDTTTLSEPDEDVGQAPVQRPKVKTKAEPSTGFSLPSDTETIEMADANPATLAKKITDAINGLADDAPPELRRSIKDIGAAIVQSFLPFVKSGAYKGVKIATGEYDIADVGGGYAVIDGYVVIMPRHFARTVLQSALASGEKFSQTAADLIEIQPLHEFFHAVTQGTLSDVEVAAVWRSLPEGVRERFKQAYTFGQDKKLSDAYLGHEFLRNRLEAVFTGKTSEQIYGEAIESTEFYAALAKMIKALSELLNNIAASLTGQERTNFEKVMNKAIANSKKAMPKEILADLEARAAAEGRSIGNDSKQTQEAEVNRKPMAGDVGSPIRSETAPAEVGAIGSSQKARAFIEANFKAVAEKMGVQLVPNMAGQLARYVVSENGKSRGGYIEYNPITMAERTPGQIMDIMREEIIHAAKDKVLAERVMKQKGIKISDQYIQSGQYHIDFYRSVHDMMTPQEREWTKKVYKSHGNRDYVIGSEFDRMVTQREVFGGLTEQAMTKNKKGVARSKALEAIKRLLKEVEAYIRRLASSNTPAAKQAKAVHTAAIKMLINIEANQKMVMAATAPSAILELDTRPYTVTNKETGEVITKDQPIKPADLPKSWVGQSVVFGRFGKEPLMAAAAPSIPLQVAVRISGKVVLGNPGQTHYDVMADWIFKNEMTASQRSHRDAEGDKYDRITSDWFDRHDIQTGFMADKFLDRKQAWQMLKDKGLKMPPLAFLPGGPSDPELDSLDLPEIERLNTPSVQASAAPVLPVDPQLNLVYAAADAKQQTKRKASNPLNQTAGPGAIEAFGGATQTPALLAWASDNGWLVEGQDLVNRLAPGGSVEEIQGGDEHDVWFDPITQRAIKLTLDDKWIAGSPSGYIENLIRENQEFSTGYAFEGIVNDNGTARLVLSQPWVIGKPATNSQIDEFFAERDYGKVKDGMFYHERKKLSVGDALPRNVLRTQDGRTQPIDVQVRVPSERQQNAYEDAIQARSNQAQAATAPVPAFNRKAAGELLADFRKIPQAEEGGDTLNLDGTKYTNGGLVVPVVSRNFDDFKEIEPEDIKQFISPDNIDIATAGGNVAKVGFYKFPNSQQASIDLNIIAPREMRQEALSIGKDLEQESLFDLDTFENVKTGATGENPRRPSVEEVRDIANRLGGSGVQVSATPTSRSDVVGGKELKGDGRSFSKFFATVTQGAADKYKPAGNYTPAIDLKPDARAFQIVRYRFRGNFDDHIATSIPGFDEVQAVVGSAIVKAYGEGGGSVLDIGASEGALNKAITSLSGGKIKTVALDPNVSMMSTFKGKDQVDGAAFELAAFGSEAEAGQVAWTEDDGTAIKFYDPGGKKFDVVHEAMVFQFISNARNAQVGRVKQLMKPDGVAIFEQKFGDRKDAFDANEDKKDRDWKSRHYTLEQLEQKRQDVLNSGGDQVEGMTALQVAHWEMEEVLRRNFNNVVQFWSSGNFRGYVASDSKQAIEAMLDGMQSTESEFATVPTPRVVAGSVMAATAPELNLGRKGDPTVLRQKNVKRLIEKQSAAHPEALPVEYIKDGKLFRLDEKGMPIASPQKYDLDESGLFKAAAKGLRGEQRMRSYIIALADKLEGFFNQIKDQPEVMAGKEWYRVAREKLTKAFGEHAPLFSQLLAATSARTPVKQNFEQALDAFNQMTSGAFDGVTERYLNALKSMEAGELVFRKSIGNNKMGDTVTPKTMRDWLDVEGILPRRSNGKKYNANSMQVLNVIAGVWREKLGGPKTAQFSDNLSGASNEATIDVWAARTLHRLSNEGYADKWRILPEAETGVDQGDFDIGQDAFRVAAARLGMNPDDLQGVLWFAEKRHWADKGWTRAAGAELSDFSSLLDFVSNEGGKLVLRIDDGQSMMVFDEPATNTNHPRDSRTQAGEAGGPGADRARAGRPVSGRSAASARGATGRGPERVAEEQEQALFATAPAFYSKLEQFIESRMPTTADSAAVAAMIEMPTSGVKKDEIKWSGIKQWLASRGDKVKRQEVLDYLRGEGQIKFNEVRLSGQIGDMPAADVLDIARNNLEDRGQSYEEWEAMEETLYDAIKDWKADKSERNRRAVERIIGIPLGELDMPPGSAATEFSQHVLPGGENYRELVVTMPGDAGESFNVVSVFSGEALNETPLTRQQAEQRIEEAENPDEWRIQKKASTGASSYTSSHFPDVPNYVAHARLNDRVDADGKPGTFIEELQSDRHQAGRKLGYYSANNKTASQEAYNKLIAEGVAPFEAMRQTDEMFKEGAIPDAPYRKDWPLMLFKRALIDAIRNGKSWIGWTTGDTQNDRYGLEKHLSEVSMSKAFSNDTRVHLEAYDKNNRRIIDRLIEPGEAAEYVGEELAARLEAMPFTKSDVETSNGSIVSRDMKRLRGLDLKVKGEAMRKFYDKMVVDEVRKYVKQWGAGVEKSGISRSDSIDLEIKQSGKLWKVGVGAFATRELAEKYVSEMKAEATPIWRVDITPQMRESIEATGQPMFATAPNLGKDYSKLTDAEYDAIPIHEIKRHRSLQRLTETRRALQALAETGGSAGGYTTPAITRVLKEQGFKEIASIDQLGYKWDLTKVEGGAEHFVWVTNEQDGPVRAIKITRGNRGTYGNYGISHHIVPYVERIEAANQIFGDDMRIEGYHPDGRLWVSQPWIDGVHPEPSELRDELIKRGWWQDPKSLSGSSYLSPDGRIMLRDAHMLNFVKSSDGEMRPLDIQIEAEATERMRLHPTDEAYPEHSIGALLDSASSVEDFGFTDQHVMAATAPDYLKGLGPDPASALLSKMAKQLPSNDQMSSFGEKAEVILPGATPEQRQRAVAEWVRRSDTPPEKVKQWEAKARRMIESDKQGVIDQVIQNYFDGADFGSPELAMAASMLTPELFKEAVSSGNPELMRKAQAFAYAHGAGATQAGRTLRALNNPHKAHKDHIREMFAQMLVTVGPRERARIAVAPTPMAKEKKIKDLQQKLREAERKLANGEIARAKETAALRKMLADTRAQLDKQQLIESYTKARSEKVRETLKLEGMTEDDIFIDAEDRLAAQESDLVRNAIEKHPKVQHEAIRYLMRGYSHEDVSKLVGMPKQAIAALHEKFRNQTLKKEVAAHVKSGNSVMDLIRSGLKKVFGLQASAPVTWGDVKKVPGLAADLKAKEAQRAANAAANKAKPKEASVDMSLSQEIDRQLSLLMPTSTQVNGTNSLKAVIVRRKGQEEVTMHVPFSPGDFQSVYRLARAISIAEASAFDKMTEWWINGMLSGPETNWVNVVGNTLATAIHFGPQRMMEMGWNIFLRDEGSASLGELKHIARGILPGIREGMKNAALAFSAEGDITGHKYLDEPMQLTFDPNGDIAKIGGYRGPAIAGKKGRLIRIPGRLLRAMDALFKTFIAQAEVGAQAYRLGRIAGKTGAELEDFITKQINTPGSKAWHLSMQEATELTFQSDNWLTDIAKTLTQTDQSRIERKLTEAVEAEADGNFMKARTAKASARALIVWSALLKLVFPFVKTPANILRVGIRKSPFGSLLLAQHAIQVFGRGVINMRNGKAFIDGADKAEFVRLLAEQTQAWVMAGFFLSAIEGDDDDDDKKLLLVGGRAPMDYGGKEAAARDYGGTYLIIIRGDDGKETRIPFGRYDPVATALGTTIDTIKQVKDSIRRNRNGEAGGGTGETVKAIMADFVNQASDKSFLQGFSSMMKHIDSIRQGRDVSQTIGRSLQYSLLTAIVPNIIRQPLRNLDDKVRDYDKIYDAYTALPIGSNAEPKIDLFGRDVEKGEMFPGSRLIIRSADKQQPRLPIQKHITSWNNKNLNDQFKPTGLRNTDYYGYIGKQKQPITDPVMRSEMDRAIGQEFSRRSQIMAENNDPNNLPKDFGKKLRDLYSDVKSDVRKKMLVSPFSSIRSSVTQKPTP